MLEVEYINTLRLAELEVIESYLKRGKRILEIGAGSGAQALELSRRGLEVTAVELANSDYAQHRVYPVTEYDGLTLPFEDGSFDLVYSSNVLEHVRDLEQLHREVRRVLSADGECVHVVPTHVWRFWTTAILLPALLRKLVPGSRQSLISGARRSASSALRRHGERGNVLTELWLFNPRWWRRNFAANGFEIVEERPVGLFYTAECLLGSKLPLAWRRALAKMLGSSTQLFRIRPPQA
jgi:SAM-dependent methyltransferase